MDKMDKLLRVIQRRIDEKSERKAKNLAHGQGYEYEEARIAIEELEGIKAWIIVNTSQENEHISKATRERDDEG